MNFAERLWTPPSWWVVSIVFSLVFAVAVLFFLGPWWALGVALGCLGVSIATLLAYGTTLLLVSEDGLRVGRSFIEWRYVAGVTPLDVETMRRRLGPAADRRAFLVVRPYIRTGVEVTVDDPPDPHPYWLVTSRHPHRLAESALRRLSAVRPAPDRPTPSGR